MELCKAAFPGFSGSEDDEVIAAAVSEAVKIDRDKLPAAWIDVTTALRFQVKDSKLTFHKVLTSLILVLSVSQSH